MQENKLGVMPIKKLIWNMSLPIMASMLVQALYNIVDSVFVSMVNEQSLTAVSLAFPAQQLMIGLATGTAVGVNALMGRALGAKQQQRANAVAENGIFLALFSFVLTAVLAVCFARPFLAGQTSIEYIIQEGTSYLLVVCGLSFALFGQVIFERLLQGTGKSIYTMYSQGLGAIVNIILDPIFIFVFKMGVTGAAVATVLGQCCGLVLSIYFNVKKNSDIQLSIRHYRPNLKIIGNIYAIGLPSVVMMAIGSVMVFLMNKILIAYHSAAETAATVFGVYFKLNSFIFMPLFGMNNGVIPIVAYNYGAQNRSRMLETVKRSTIYATCIMVVGMGIFLAIPGTLLSFFHASPTMLAVGKPALRIISLSFSMAGACIALSSSFQALGYSVYSMIISFVRQLIFLIPAAYVLARIGAQAGNDDLVWWSYVIAEVFSLLMTVLFFRRLYRKTIAPLPLDGGARTPAKDDQEPQQ
jgi:putative MATE family efflux protein